MVNESPINLTEGVSMARYLVLEFKDNDQAQHFMDKILSESRGGALYRVVGLFVRPGRTCKCWDWNKKNYQDPSKMKHSGSGIQRGEKFGWWVCTDCGKPRKSGHHLVNQLAPNKVFTDVVTEDEYEMVVSQLQITGILTSRVDRPKKLKPKKKKKKE